MVGGLKEQFVRRRALVARVLLVGSKRGIGREGYTRRRGCQKTMLVQCQTWARGPKLRTNNRTKLGVVLEKGDFDGRGGRVKSYLFGGTISSLGSVALALLFGMVGHVGLCWVSSGISADATRDTNFFAKTLLSTTAA